MEEKLCTLHNRPISDDYDAFKPCFFDEVETEEEFYDVPAPSEDIWKKFELLPTPPRSPKHETNYGSTGPMTSTVEKLQMVSDILEPFTSDFSMFPEDCALCSRDTLLFTSCTGLDHDDDKELNQNLKSNLIQDCMWSGHMGIALETKVKELDAPVGTSLCNADVSVSTTVCVNPQSVFPYPLNEGERETASSSANVEIDTPSDSDDDDDDDDIEDDEEEEEDDAEDEEIDVVSVSERHGPISDHRYTVSVPPSVSVSAHVAAMHNYTAPRPSSIKSEPLSPSASSTHSHSPSSSRKRQRSLVGRPSKRPRLTLHLSSHKVKSSRLSAASSRSSSDSEDGSEGSKRSQHNILERKRRNDLKSSFHILRDHIPELSTQERAPKVVILKKASDYITQLQKTSQLLQSEHERLRSRREQLKQKLKLLQRQ